MLSAEGPEPPRGHRAAHAGPEGPAITGNARDPREDLRPGRRPPEGAPGVERDGEAKQRGQANAVTYGCMIDACVKCGHLEKAVEIFKGMRAEKKHKKSLTIILRNFLKLKNTWIGQLSKLERKNMLKLLWEEEDI